MSVSVSVVDTQRADGVVVHVFTVYRDGVVVRREERECDPCMCSAAGPFTVTHDAAVTAVS